MSILTEVMPNYVVVGGRAYPINTDFRVWLEFDCIMQNRDIKTEDKIGRIFRLCFSPKCRVLPENAESAVSALLGFYMREKRKGGAGGKRVFSFEEDADYIYAAFLTQYGIDLLSVPYLHWYSFYALLKGLSDDLRLMKIVSVRSVDTGEIRDNERKKYYRRLQEVYALADNRTDEEKEHDAAEILYGAMMRCGGNDEVI